VLAPISLNIFLVHAILAPEGLPLAVIIGALMIYLSFFAEPYAAVIRPVFRPRPCRCRVSLMARKTAVPGFLRPKLAREYDVLAVTSGVSAWSGGAGMGRGGILVRYTPAPACNEARVDLREAWPPAHATDDLVWGEGRRYPRSVNRRQERPMRAR
jgi:hypothetical protein